MRRATGLMLTVLFLSVSGCGPDEARGRWGARGSWSAASGKTTVNGDVECLGRNDEILVMLLCDSRWDRKVSITLSGNGLKGTGELPSTIGEPKTFSFDSPKSGSGQITFGKETLDLSKGRLILIRTKGGSLAVQQIDHDLKALLRRTDSQHGPSYGIVIERVQDLAATNEIVREFLKLEPNKAAP